MAGSKPSDIHRALQKISTTQWKNIPIPLVQAINVFKSEIIALNIRTVQAREALHALENGEAVRMNQCRKQLELMQHEAAKEKRNLLRMQEAHLQEIRDVTGFSIQQSLEDFNVKVDAETRAKLTLLKDEIGSWIDEKVATAMRIQDAKFNEALQRSGEVLKDMMNVKGRVDWKVHDEHLAKKFGVHRVLGHWLYQNDLQAGDKILELKRELSRVDELESRVRAAHSIAERQEVRVTENVQHLIQYMELAQKVEERGLSHQRQLEETRDQLLEMAKDLQLRMKEADEHHEARLQENNEKNRKKFA